MAKGKKVKELELTPFEPEEDAGPKSRERKPIPAYEIGTTNSGRKLFQVHRFNPQQGMTLYPVKLSEHLVTKNPLGFVKYDAASQKVGSVTVYFVEGDSVEQFEKLTGDKFELRHVPESLDERVDKQFNIRGSINGPMLTSLANRNIAVNPQIIMNAMRHDISSHCTGYEAKKSVLDEIGFILAESVELPKPKYIAPVEGRWIMPGKGYHAEKCSLTLGNDFYLGCFMYMTTDGFFDYDLGCTDCYAGYKNKNDPRMTVFRFDEKQHMDKMLSVLEEIRLSKEAAFGRPVPRDNKPVILRMGVSTEPNLPPELCEAWGINNQIDIALRTVVYIREKANGFENFERKIVPVITTRMPNFSSETKDLIRRSGATIMISAGYDSTERGALGLGYGLDRRLELEEDLRSEGIPTAIFAMLDITRHYDEAHPDAKKVMHWYNKNRLNGARVQFLDARIKGGSERALRIGGAERSELVHTGQPDLFDPTAIEKQRYQRTGQNYLAAARMHPSFKELIGNNTGSLRMCYTHPSVDRPHEAECGNCFINYHGKVTNSISDQIPLKDEPLSLKNGSMIKLYQI
jgi:hypothetical protein